MPSLRQIFSVSCGLSLLLRWSAPQYYPGLLASGLILFFGQLLIYGIWFAVIYPRFFSPLRHLPEPPNAAFFTGHTKQVFGAATGDPAKEWIDTVPNDGLIRYSMWLKERVLVTQPAAISDLLVTKSYQFQKPREMRNGLGRILGVGILLAEGDEHKFQRKNLMPAFSYRHIKDIYPVFWRKSNELVQRLSSAISTLDESKEISPETSSTSAVQHEAGAIEVGHWVSRAALDIIGLSGMGQDFNALEDPTNKLSQTYQKVIGNNGGRYLQLLGIVVPFAILIRLPIKFNQEMSEATQLIRKTCRDLITKKRKVMEEKGRSEVDILSVALESGGFTDENLVDQMMTFLAAGHETTATAMIGALYHLCQHPEIQQKLRDEIRAHIPPPDQEIKTSDIDDCQYLQAVCSESLRLWSPVNMTLRIAACDTSLNGQFIPKGTPVIICPKAVNVSKQLWGEDAREFKPERFLDANGKANHQGSAKSVYSSLTFLHGPRSCIGQRFAQAEFACMLAAWVGRFDTRFEADSPLAKGHIEYTSGITSKPKGGLWCKLTEVPGW